MTVVNCAQAKAQIKHRNCRPSTEATSTAPKHSKQIKLQRPTIQDAKLMEKNDAMANQFFKYNTFRLESLGDNISATSWISNAEKSNQEAQQC
ncbi:unnamed protein product [Peronospora farinosa]|uniref:Uncharacterized protein n=1 Tax=Peronospora farinosa TaxID=134698 RepID=A0ABN8BST0_9STRA|nr:unnamed protein product [Peronospora farinosa]